MKYKNIIKLRLLEIQLSAIVPTQLKFSIVKDHDEPSILLFETLFCMRECFNMGTELPTKVMMGQTLVLIKMTFLNNVRKVGRLVLSRTSCFSYKEALWSCSDIQLILPCRLELRNDPDMEDLVKYPITIFALLPAILTEAFLGFLQSLTELFCMGVKLVSHFKADMPNSRPFSIFHAARLSSRIIHDVRPQRFQMHTK
jgi:hypothetical protein